MTTYPLANTIFAILSTPSPPRQSRREACLEVSSLSLLYDVRTDTHASPRAQPLELFPATSGFLQAALATVVSLGAPS